MPVSEVPISLRVGHLEFPDLACGELRRGSHCRPCPSLDGALPTAPSRPGQETTYASNYIMRESQNGIVTIATGFLLGIVILLIFCWIGYTLDLTTGFYGFGTQRLP